MGGLLLPAKHWVHVQPLDLRQRACTPPRSVHGEGPAEYRPRTRSPFSQDCERCDGTILVDLTRHQVIDLLPSRQAKIAAAWMRQHPEIEVVSRDRGEEYAIAARQGAPQA